MDRDWVGGPCASEFSGILSREASMPKVRLLSRKCEIAAYVLAAAALCILVWGIWDLYSYRIASYRWIPLMVLCFLSIPFATSLPFGIFYIGLPPLMAIGMLHSVSLCVLVTAGYCLVASLMIRTYPGIRFSAFLMIVSVMVCNAFLCGIAFRLIRELTPEHAIIGALAAAFITHLVYSRFIPGKPRHRLSVNAILCTVPPVLLDFRDPFIPMPILMALVWFWTFISSRKVRRALGATLSIAPRERESSGEVRH